jgi:hypothetical protein
MFDVTERVRTVLYQLDSDNVNSLTSPLLHLECLLATSAVCFCLQKWMKNWQMRFNSAFKGLIELVRICDMTCQIRSIVTVLSLFITAVCIN